MSQNAAYSMITALGIQLQDVPVIQFVCEGGMSRCVLGSRKEDFSVRPPCKRCKAQSRHVFKDMNVVSFEYDENEQLRIQP